MNVLVLVPQAFVFPHPLPGGTELVRYHTAVEAVVALRAGDGPAVIFSDGLLDSGSAEAVAAAIRASGRSVIEVRGQRWDGETASPISAVCRGVVSGFGAAGLLAAIEQAG